MTLLMPRKVKYRKHQKGKIPPRASRGNRVSFGDWGLRSLEPAWVTARQLEAARRAMTRFVQKGGKIWIRVFPQKPITRKGAEMPMGKGKGPVDHYVAIVKPGMILFEIEGVTETQAREAMTLAGHKLPVKCNFVKKH